MLSVYTRHHPDCKNADDKTWRRCGCPKWIWGSLDGKFIRQSARTHRWEEAEELRRQLSEGLVSASRPLTVPVPDIVAAPAPPPIADPVRPKKPRVTVEAAVKAYLADAVSRGVAPATLTKLTTIFRKQFLAWTRIEGIEYLDELDLDALLNFRNTWEDGPLAKQKKQSRVIGFFWACVRRRYLTENPAIGLGKIKVVQIPTDYFPPDEFERIIAATYIRRGDRGGGDVKANQMRLRTMTLLMRWSGLRIRDAVTLERHRLNGDSLLLYQAKTGTPVYVPIPPNVVDALENIPPGPKPNPRYFFWSGDGDPIRRRSLYVRVEHPTPAREAEIIASRTPDADEKFHREMAGIALSFRNYSLEKPPSVSEMIDFANALRLLGADHVTEDLRDVLLPFLAKTEKDRRHLLLREGFKSLLDDGARFAARLTVPEATE